MNVETGINEDIEAFLAAWHNDSQQTMTVYTSGSTGQPKAMEVSKAQMRASAWATLRFLGLAPGHTALLCLPLRYIAGQMMLVRAEVGQLELHVVEPSSRPLSTCSEAPYFAAMTPMQVYESLRHPSDAALLREVRQLIVGGGAVSAELEALLVDFPHAVWSTYGMTETLSHVAMRRLNGAERSDYYTPLEGVTISQDAVRHTLNVYAPYVCDVPLATNDVCEVTDDGHFKILGRVDNVVCSGGVKLQIEQLEARLSTVFDAPFALTRVPDAALGEALTLLYCEGCLAEEALKRCAAVLTRIECPKWAYAVSALPMTATDKPARADIQALALALWKAENRPS